MPTARPQTIGSLGEFGFLRRMLPTLPGGKGILVGPGDDCAVVRIGGRPVLVTTDALVENVHFRRTWMSPSQVGRKAFLVNASDIAAMGGRPRYCVVSVGAPPEYPSRALAAIHRGIAAAADETGARVVGGNLAGAAELFVSITLIGEAPPRPALRRGARAGDLLYVTGTFGEGALGLLMLRENEEARGRAVRRFREPTPRLKSGELLARRGCASALIDVSDGLLQDLGHLCESSGVGAEIEAERIPVSAPVRRVGMNLALAGGEDYELLCAVPVRNQARVESLRPTLGCRLTRIGRCLPRRDGIRLVDAAGRVSRPRDGGFDHFAARKRR